MLNKLLQELVWRGNRSKKKYQIIQIELLNDY